MARMIAVAGVRMPPGARLAASCLFSLPVPFRLIAILCIVSSVVALGQIERDQRGVDLESGLIGSWREMLPIAKDARLPLPTDIPAVGDLALAFALEMRERSAAGQPRHLMSIESSGGRTLTVSLAPGGGISCQLPNVPEFATPPPTSGAEQSRHVVINIRRNPRQPLSGIWIDGVEMTSVAVRPGAWRLRDPSIVLGGGEPGGSLSQLRLYNRALERSEIIALALRGRGAQTKPTWPEFTGTLDFRDGEVIALLGGSDAVALAEDWRFGAMLHLSSAGKGLRFRSLAWEADTVFRSDRPLGFGDLRQQLQRVEPTCVLLMFGRQECLERGAAGLADFEAALNQMLAVCQASTRRLAIIGAAPFERKDPPLPDLSLSNPVLQQYNLVMERAARRQRALFVDVWARLPRKTVATTDGMQLSSAGLYDLADAVLRARIPEHEEFRMAPVVARGLREPIERINRIWHAYWRPSNWAFLHGDRTAQPSSRDHADPTKRWFPAEVEKYRALIDAQEQEIWKLAADIVGGKLP